MGIIWIEEEGLEIKCFIDDSYYGIGENGDRYIIHTYNYALVMYKFLQGSTEPTEVALGYRQNLKEESFFCDTNYLLNRFFFSSVCEEVVDKFSIEPYGNIIKEKPFHISIINSISKKKDMLHELSEFKEQYGNLDLKRLNKEMGYFTRRMSSILESAFGDIMFEDVSRNNYNGECKKKRIKNKI